MSSVPIESSFDGDTSPIGQGSSGNISPRKRTATGRQWVRRRIVNMDSTILASGARKAVVLLYSAASGQSAHIAGRCQGAWVGHPRNRVSPPISRWLRRVQRPLVRSLALGFVTLHGDQSRWSWPQTMQSHPRTLAHTHARTRVHPQIPLRAIFLAPGHHV